MSDTGRFLRDAGWHEAQLRPLAGDASARSYARLTRNGQSAILMDAAADGSAPAFAQVARWLSAHGLSAPRILAADEDAGLLLLEDLGDGLFTAHCADHPGDEPALYAAAAGTLAAIHAAPAPEFLAPLTAADLTAMTAPLSEWYLAGMPDAAARQAAIEAAIGPLLAEIEPDIPVVCLRDFHAGNLIWLPGRKGSARTGLLDFQDAFMGHPAYDLMSLVQDARRDVSSAATRAAYDAYAAASGADLDALAHASAVLGAQRHLRILGIFARLARQAGKPHYLPLLPRVWSDLQRCLAAPALAPLRAACAGLPAPDPEHLARLESLCPAPAR